MSYGYTNYTIVFREYVPAFTFTEYKRWLSEKLGKNDWEWSGGNTEPIRIWFRNQEDLLAFKLVFGIYAV